MTIKVDKELADKIAIVVVNDGVAEVEYEPKGIDVFVFDNDYMKESLGIDYYEYADFGSLWKAYQDTEEEHFNL